MSKQQLNLDSTEFQPKQEYILVKPQELQSERTTEGGIIVPMAKQGAVGDRPTSGIVISVGDDITGVEVGDFVIWPGTDGLDLDFNDGEFLLLREKSVIGKKIQS